jgi:ABC-type transport system involved in multi-copper enzyme maturation permease subunit
MRWTPFWASFYETWLRPVNDWIAPSSPFTLITRSGSSNGAALIEALSWMMGLQLAYGALFVLLAVARLRPGFRKEGEGSRWFASARRGRRLLPRPACGDDAMLWKERYVSRTAPMTKIVAGLLGLFLFGLLAYSLYDLAGPAFDELRVSGYGSDGPARTELSRFLRVFTALIYIGWALGLASASSGAVVQEREADTWISLVSTPLSGREIVRAKMFGAFWGMRWLGLILLAIWVVGLSAGSVHPFAFVTVVIEAAVFLWFVAALGMFFSVRAKSSARAMTTTVAILIVLNGGYLMCCIPLQPNTPFIAVGVTPFLLPASLFTYDEFRILIEAPYPGPRWHYAETFATCFTGVSAYAVAAGILTMVTIARFDDWIGRPRDTWDAPRLIEFAKPEPDEEGP